LVLAEYGLQDRAYEINLVAAKLARAAAEKYSTPEKPRFVAGSIGPTTKAISVTGGVTFEELIENFAAQAQALYDGGVDYFLLETCQDTRNVKAGILGIQRVLEKAAVKIPIAVSITIEPMGTMLAGQGVESLATSLEHVELLYLGLNCATGPEFMTDHIRTLAGMAGTRIACVPNAGLPDEEGRYLENPEMVAAVLRRFGEAGWVNLLGGCCGTHAGHIRALSKLARDLTPPDLVIYLQSPTDVLKRRLRDWSRRHPEVASPPGDEYIAELNEAYNHFFFHYTATPLLVVETSQFDLSWGDDALDDVLKQIKTMTRGTRYYVPRTS